MRTAFASVYPTVWQEPITTTGVVAVRYGLTTDDRVHQAVPPDGLTGLVLIDGRVWWLGPQTHPWRPAQFGVDVVGLRITLQWGHTVLREPLHTRRNARIPVDELWPAPSPPEGPLDPLGGSPVSPLMKVLESRVSQKTVDPFAEKMAGLIHTGGSTVVSLADQVELSVRQLHRRCLVSFGLAPSTLLRINRLHRVAAQARRDDNQGLADLAVNAGYVDQAHLSRDTRQLVGEQAKTAFAVAPNVRFVQYPR